MTVDAVQVWLADALVPDTALPAMFTLLDDDERRRHAAIVHSIDRRRFVVAHAVTRRIVGAALDAPAHELRWAHNANGKPSLTGAYTGVEVNLSHSGDLVMVAVSGRRPVGVDLQRVMPTLDCAAMARRFYPPAEAHLVTGDGGHERFAALWARKESLVKAAGARLTRGLATPVAGPAPVVVEHDGPFRIEDLDAPDGFRAAVALAGDAPFTVTQHVCEAA
ncbi:4'-phosphopantetheinyl transferase superfamily protein [Dactylosporangium sp. NBC_01737]|uniref:4'-phosphopantetheinyl transferase family protein n=1 Tax=Dactylosporangium sp. NBC_01737 TaxID=2975959 RepID=UPI002E0EAC4C|nr:4'-phosphopantetheinyl transferase superfamily protein [Dactylosporangium sp. NBC_01737]